MKLRLNDAERRIVGCTNDQIVRSKLIPNKRLFTNKTHKLFSYYDVEKLPNQEQYINGYVVYSQDLICPIAAWFQQTDRWYVDGGLLAQAVVARLTGAPLPVDRIELEIHQRTVAVSLNSAGIKPTNVDLRKMLGIGEE